MLTCTSEEFGRHTTDLLEHLIYIAENRSVQVSVLVHDETVLESSLRHLKYSVLDGIEFALNDRVVLWKI